MAELGFNEAYRTDEFVVEIEGIESPGITKVTGLSDGEIESIDQPDGGSPVHHKISSGIVKFGDVTLERNMDGSPTDDAFKLWFQQMFKLDGTGGGSGPHYRRNGSVVKKQYGDGSAPLCVRGRVDQVVQVHRPGRGRLGAR